VRAILTYHSVDDSGSPISIPEAVFRRHIQWLAAHGPPVVTVAQLLLTDRRTSAVALTFDDAFGNFAELAWPILRDHGMTATLYVPTARVGATNAWHGRAAPGIPTLPLLGWDALARLLEEGAVLGSHTCTHRRLTRLSVPELRDELEQSQAALWQHLGTHATGLAYPFGACNADVTEAAARLYQHAVTVELRPLGGAEDPHRLPRIDMYYLRDNPLLEAWGTRRLRLYLGARAGVRRCRSLLAG